MTSTGENTESSTEVIAPVHPPGENSGPPSQINDPPGQELNIQAAFLKLSADFGKLTSHLGISISISIIYLPSGTRGMVAQSPEPEAHDKSD